MDQERFAAACRAVLEGEAAASGIGTLSEKTIHAVLKGYFEPSPDNQEVKLASFVADAVCEAGVIEVQTRQFFRLVPKLTAFLEAARVTVVYPTAQTKWIRRIDPETGSLSDRRKSPKRGSVYSVLPELYGIRQLLENPRLRICVILLEVEEVRSPAGSGKGWRARFYADRTPLALCEEVYFGGEEGYAGLIPPGLPAEFCSEEFRRAAGLRLSEAQAGLNVLWTLGEVERVGKKGRAYLYRRK